MERAFTLDVRRVKPAPGSMRPAASPMFVRTGGFPSVSLILQTFGSLPSAFFLELRSVAYSGTGRCNELVRELISAVPESARRIWAPIAFVVDPV
jgi:hypothetical protein